MSVLLNLLAWFELFVYILHELHRDTVVQKKLSFWLCRKLWRCLNVETLKSFLTDMDLKWTRWHSRTACLAVANFFFQVSLRHLPTPVSKVYSLLDFTNLLLKSIGNYDSLFNYFTSDKTHHYESEQLNVHNRRHTKWV